ncbi:SDR family NAD(P)-dependent oxidoreductase [Amycolatopsis jejuensis]|uniref:SDR family NAD(P)-dependent oxidoreductase n=1 Tax=Amycolatopsis jejuensis TaxID=330084 RepID=UPI00068F4E20|nr:SDR family NAD(P)-dependent oxidoreductase [Amycolatopsis jejuensis]
MKPLAGRAAIVTGGAGGLGRAHARYLASLGASVLVCDLARADEVVEELAAQGFSAAAHQCDISGWTEARDLVDACVDAFGGLDILVNNAGIVRDRTMANMTESEWDDVLRVNLKGHAAPSIHAMAYWKKQVKAGNPVRGSIVHTSSIGGLMANFGQGNYTSAKLGIVGLSSVLALEGEAIGVRSNVIAPSARTGLAVQAMPTTEQFDRPAEAGGFDFWDPANVSPMVGWLASPGCTATGQVFSVAGNEVRLFAPPTPLRHFTTDGRWTLEDLDRRIGRDLPKWPTALEFLETFDEKAPADG